MDGFFTHYAHWEWYLAAGQAWLFMLGMGLTLTVGDFTSEWRRPGSLLLGLFMLLGVSPLIAMAIGQGMGLPAGIALGLLLIALMPGGTLSNVFTYIGGGNVPLSISLTSVATVASLITIPTLLPLYGGIWVPAGTEFPLGTLLRDAALLLCLPVGIGMVIGANLAPEGRNFWANQAVGGGMVLLALMTIGSLGSKQIEIGSYGWTTPLTIIVFCVVMSTSGMIPYRLFGWSGRDRMAVGIEVAVRNVSFALLLKASLFPATDGPPDPLAKGVLYSILFYGATSLVVGFFPVVVYRREARRLKQRESQASEESANTRLAG